MRKVWLIILLTSLAMWAHALPDDKYSIVFHSEGNNYAVPTEFVDSITFPEISPSMLVNFLNGKQRVVSSIDYVDIQSVSDTLFLQFNEEGVSFSNPHIEAIDLVLLQSDVEIKSRGLPNLVISASGRCSDGKIKLDTDTTCTVRLNNLQLTSSHAPAFNMTSKQKMRIELVDGTENYLSDAETYVFNDTIEEANGCLNSLGHIDVVGSGKLFISGRNKHAISSKKGIRFKEGNINVNYAKSDAIHSGKYISVEGSCLSLNGQTEDGLDADEDVQITEGKLSVCEKGTGFKAIKCGGTFQQTGGSLEINIIGDAGKGIKAKKDIFFRGGTIIAMSEGGVIIEDGDPSFCSIIKGDSNIEISGGYFFLVNNSDGGKCISCDGNMTIQGGLFSLQTNGNGAGYVNQSNEKDYYTPKCITAEDTLLIFGGEITCLSSGLGAKGLVAENIIIGTEASPESGPVISVETQGTCIVDDLETDQRFGCPKGIKANNELNIYSGHISATTHGLGGEGIESNHLMNVFGGAIFCHTFDDGINIGESLIINDGIVYCNSTNNDGIDSNGSIVINGGIVAAVNQMRPDESFDTEGEQLYLNGGTVIGLGSGPVKIAEAAYPYYNTEGELSPTDLRLHGLELTYEKYIYIIHADRILVALKNENRGKRGAFVTAMTKDFIENEQCSIYEGDLPLSPDYNLDNRLIIGGKAQNMNYILDFFPTQSNIE